MGAVGAHSSVYPKDNWPSLKDLQDAGIMRPPGVSRWTTAKTAERQLSSTSRNLKHSSSEAAVLGRRPSIDAQVGGSTVAINRNASM